MPGPAYPGFAGGLCPFPNPRQNKPGLLPPSSAFGRLPNKQRRKPCPGGRRHRGVCLHPRGNGGRRMRGSACPSLHRPRKRCHRPCPGRWFWNRAERKYNKCRSRTVFSPDCSAVRWPCPKKRVGPNMIPRGFPCRQGPPGFSHPGRWRPRSRYDPASGQSGATRSRLWFPKP